jgi:hypothetical protein
MAKSNRCNPVVVEQIIYDQPRKLFVERYLSPSAKKRAFLAGIPEKKALEIYGKNRYRINPDAKPVRYQDKATGMWKTKVILHHLHNYAH